MKGNFAPKLKERIVAEKRTIGEIKSSEERWDEIGGAYDKPFVGVTKGGALVEVQTRTSPEDLVGMEVILYEEIKSRLERAHGSRVIVVDFGGAQGISFMRIANKLDEQLAAVKTGRLVMVVTSLSEPEKISTDGLTQPEKDFLDAHRHKHLITHITGGAAALYKARITTPDGDVPIRGNVAVLHENFAVCHSYTPEITLFLLEQCLKQDAVFFLESGGARAKFHDQYANERQVAFELGLRTILGSNLVAQDTSKYGEVRYTILKRPQSPDVQIDVSPIVR